MTTPILSDEAIDRIDNALGRMAMKGEIIKAVDYTLVMLPTPQGIRLASVFYLAMSNPILGQPDITNVHTDTPTMDQVRIDQMVRTSLESLRSIRAELLRAGNGKQP